MTVKLTNLEGWKDVVLICVKDGKIDENGFAVFVQSLEGLMTEIANQSSERENQPKISSAPQWLKDRMKALRELPFPTAEQVARQFESVRNSREKDKTVEELGELDEKGRWVIR